MASRVLIIGNAAALRERLGRYLETQGCQVDVVQDCLVGLERVGQAEYDLLLVDLRAPGVEARALAKGFARSCPDSTWLVISGAEQRPAASEAMRAGAYDALEEPLDDWKVEFVLSRALERTRLVREGTGGRLLLSNFPGVVFWGSARFEVELVQGRVQEITGYPPETFTEQGLRWDAIIHAPDLAETFSQARQSITRGEQSQLQFRLERPDGELRWVECVLVPVMSAQGRIQSVSGIMLDIAERKRAELALKQHLQEQETLFAIGQMVSSSLQIDEVLRQVAEQMTRLVDAASCVISDWDSADDRLTVQTAYVRPGLENLGAWVDEIGRTYDVSTYPATAGALREQEPVVVHARSLQDGQQERRLQLSSVAGIPLVVKGRVTGLAEVYLAEQGQSFEFHDLRLLQALANQVAVAIDNARLFSAAQANEAAMRDLSLRLINVQEQERRYIAQELHDELGQTLTATKIDIDLARRKISRLEMDDLAQAQYRLDEASALTDEMLSSVRAMTVELRPTLLDDMGIVPTLRWYLERFALRNGVQAQLEASELPTRLCTEIETTIYRVVQEALTNVARHAQASQVRVYLAWQDDTVTTLIEDDGKGFDVRAWFQRSGEQQQTLGLIGIRERVMLLGGRADVESRVGEGTRIEIELPASFRVE